MELVGLVLVALVVGLFLYLVGSAPARPEKFPPGPPAVPIWGSYLQLLLENYKYPYLVLDDMTKRYKSKVLGFYFGSVPAVAVCDYESAKEAMNNPHLQGRILNIVAEERMYNKHLGIVFPEGPTWMDQKRFALRHMRDFGFGRRSDQLESEIEAELKDLLELIGGGRDDLAVVRPSSDSASPRRVLLPDALFPTFVNAILAVYTGARLPRAADETARFLSKAGLQFHQSSDATGGFLSLHSWLSVVAPKMSGYRDGMEGSLKMRTYLEKLIEEHKKTYSEDHERGFIDSYLKAVKKHEETEGNSPFNTDQLAIILMDFLLPAITALATTATWALMYVAHHPYVMRRVQEEVDSVVGRGRLPNLNDRQNMPYTEATLRETMRRKTLLPISIPHKATEDTTLQGHSIPKNSAVIHCLWSMHMDKDLWGDPENFRPERFLEEDGTLKKKDFTLPFGAGKRLCPGETFARQNLFLAFSAILQNFSLSADGVPPMDCSIPGNIETQPPFWARFEAR